MTRWTGERQVAAKADRQIRAVRPLAYVRHGSERIGCCRARRKDLVDHGRADEALIGQDSILLILPPAVAKMQGHLPHGTGWCCLSDMAQIPKGFPVRRLLIAFAIILLGPVLALAAVALSQYAASERTRYVEDGRKAARQIAADVDHELGKVQAAAEALATSPLIANGDYEAFQRQASKFLQTWAPDEPDAYAVILRDLNGQQLVNTRLPWGTPLPKVERDVDRLVITTKRPQVQDLFFSTSANRLMIAVRVPVLEDGGVTHVLSLALEPRRIAKLLQA